MSNNCLITLSVGSNYSKMESLATPRMLNYCKKYDLHHIIMRDKLFDHPAYNKLLLKNYINNFDRILFMDMDVIIRNDAPNIFDIVPEDSLGIFDEEYLQICKCARETIDLYNSHTNENIQWDGKYFNTGIIVFNKENIKILNEDLPMLDEFYADQGYINYQINRKKIKVFDIGFQFNGLNNPKITGKDRLLNSYFIHCNGGNTFGDKSEYLRFEIDNVKSLEAELNI